MEDLNNDFVRIPLKKFFELKNISKSYFYAHIEDFESSQNIRIIKINGRRRFIEVKKKNLIFINKDNELIY